MTGWLPRRVVTAMTARACLIALVSGTVCLLLAGGVIAGEDAGTATPDQERGEFGFGNDTYRVDPPDTAEVDLTVPDGGVFTVIVASPGDHFTVEVTAGAPASGDDAGRPTVRLDTGNVSAGDPAEYLSVANATVHRITVHQQDVEARGVPGGQYDLRAVRGDERASATLRVSPTVSVAFETRPRHTDLERDPVRTITGETELSPGERIEVRITSTGRDAFRIRSEAVVGEDGRFETAVDLAPIPPGASFDVTAHHDGVTRARQAVDPLGDLPEPIDGRQVSDGVTFAYEGDQLSLEAATNQTITGETTLPGGEVVTIILRSPESHLVLTTAKVDRFGNFEVTADLTGLTPRNDVIVSAVSDGGASGAAPARIVRPATPGGVDDPDPGELLLDDQGGSDAAAARDPRLVPGIVAVGVGVVLSLVGSGLLLGLDPAGLSPRRE